jgi:HAD superfamily hydrolase (TIGR01509 family)
MNIGKYKIKLIIFDMDGLMFDTERLASRHWKEAGIKFNYKIDDEVFKETIGLNIIKTEEIYRKHYGAGFPFEKIKNEKINMAENYILSKGVPLKEGIHELLEYIKEKQLKIALATSTNRNKTELLLNLSNTKKYFDIITCGDEIINGKPDPEIFLKTSQKINCQSINCIVLEDSENGIIAAYKAGMLPIMIPDINESREEIEAMLFKKFNNLKEVKDYFEDNLKA